ncbi:MAG: MoaD/ThiS family protein [Bacillota bacterium]
MRVYGSHKRLLPQGDVAVVPYLDGETVQALLTRLNIPDEDIWLIVVNEVLVSEDFMLSPGDKVGVMSPVGGG